MAGTSQGLNLPYKELFLQGMSTWKKTKTCLKKKKNRVDVKV